MWHKMKVRTDERKKERKKERNIVKQVKTKEAYPIRKKLVDQSIGAIFIGDIENRNIIINLNFILGLGIVSLVT